ncbi:MAG: hypothetical protein M1831_004392 [Alyxoria varia]|nr:MAG: hypothetical protein M1831_004392 [Alyxoria varia]
MLSALPVLALWISARSNAPTLVFAAPLRSTSGTLVSLAPALAVQISKVQDVGVRTGTAFAVISAAELTGNPTAGALPVRNGGDYVYLQVFCGLCMAFGTSLIGISSGAGGVEEARVKASQYFPEFNLQDKVIVVTGGGRGLGLTVAEALFQGGAIVHCLDRLEKPQDDFLAVQNRTDLELGGELHYHSIDIQNTEALHKLIEDIAARQKRLDGLFGAAGILEVASALEYEAKDINRMLNINYTALFMTAQGVAREMKRYGNGGSMVLVASMSGIVANKGLQSPAYNSSKAAVNQLARNLAMEWAPDRIRVNSLCPGHILTPMVQKHMDDNPESARIWRSESMLQRIARPEEFRGPAVYLLSDASSYQTASVTVVDGGHTAW